MKYFINAVGYGPGSLETEFNTEIERDQPISSLQDVQEIERTLARPYQSRVLIRSWQKFESDVIAGQPCVHGENPEHAAALILADLEKVSDRIAGLKNLSLADIDPNRDLTEGEIRRLAEMEPEMGIFAAGGLADAGLINRTRVAELRGKYSHISTSSEDFAAQKADEVEIKE
uniref:hypothetical protein n=1 Tax=Trichocoleus desertorum TaxID=1481672 RepID=UPI0025B2B777|nr:hypothetical protein [Trichocoleus desertorum]